MTAGLPEGHRLRSLETQDIPALIEIEARATALLASADIAALASEPPPDRLQFEALFAGKGVWVAVTEHDDRPCGYAVAGDCDGLFWLYQMSVDPDHGRKGIGAALLTAVLDHARWAFYNAVGLTTFRDVPFNAPFYRRHGFTVVDLQRAPAAIRERFASEVPTGCAAEQRVLMIRKL